MIDYLFCFSDKVAAIAALPDFWTPPSVEGDVMAPGSWDGSRVLSMKIQVGSRPAGTDVETGALIEAPVYAQGYWLAIAMPAVTERLWALPGCMREADREAAESGGRYVLRERFSAEQLASAWDLSRQWLGADYAREP